MNSTLHTWAGGARADLHVHTQASDSRWTPAQVVDGCLDEGIELLAIADHNTTAAVAEAESLALRAGLGFVPAVEISTTVDDLLIHILGYGIDTDNAELQACLAEIRAREEDQREQDAHHLQTLGYPVSAAAYRAYHHDPRRGSFKLVTYLIDAGVITDLRNFGQTIAPQLERPWPAYVHPTEAVAAIRAAGGVPVMAHPGGSLAKHGGLTDANLERVLTYGIVGFECFTPYHDLAAIGTCLQFCYGLDLIITGGSDFHGHLIGRQLGVPQVRTDQLRLHEISDHIRYHEIAPVIVPAL
jgi:3',5'-nucleoside bisphosphate phosphatase